MIFDDAKKKQRFIGNKWTTNMSGLNVILAKKFPQAEPELKTNRMEALKANIKKQTIIKQSNLFIFNIYLDGTIDCAT